MTAAPLERVPVDAPRPVGTDRSGDPLLSLDEHAVRVRAGIIQIARQLHRATLIGNPPPFLARMGERLRNPLPGDYVVATSVPGRIHRQPDGWHEVHGFGVLLARRIEVIPYVDAAGSFDDAVWYVQYGPAPVDVVRWENEDMIGAPVTWRSADDW